MAMNTDSDYQARAPAPASASPAPTPTPAPEVYPLLPRSKVCRPKANDGPTGEEFRPSYNKGNNAGQDDKGLKFFSHQTETVRLQASTVNINASSINLNLNGASTVNLNVNIPTSKVLQHGLMAGLCGGLLTGVSLIILGIMLSKYCDSVISELGLLRSGALAELGHFRSEIGLLGIGALTEIGHLRTILEEWERAGFPPLITLLRLF